MNSRDENISLLKALACLAADIALVYVCYFVCRAIFLVANYDFYAQGVFGPNFWNLFNGSLVFDTSGIIYTNIPFIVMAIFPLHFKEGADAYAKVLKWMYLILNSIGIVANLVDVVYFRWTNRRSTASVFQEFAGEDNVGQILGSECLRHWYLVLAAVLLVWMLWKLYRSPLTFRPSHDVLAYIKYYVFRLLTAAAIVLLCMAGMRGGIDRSTRPITISNANQYIQNPIEAPLILNTPFSIIRTLGKKTFVIPRYFDTEEELASVYTPEHYPVADSIPFQKKNVVVLIVESFGREYIGAYNKWLEDSTYQGYTPFIDSLIQHSLIFQHSYVNGRKSIDGMPSVLSGIPYFIEPFFLTPAALNHLDGLAVELGSAGYQTAFFHGAKNGSMGFQAFANATGFQKYYGRTEFNEAPQYGGDSEFDGFWAIWDEPFLQFYADEMGKMQEPFMTAVFTASNHHPYQIPEKYRSKYPEEGIEIHKCVRYTDNALRRFFDNAKHQPWYNNTVFVICSDHTNLSDHEEYQTDLGLFAGPVIFYSPADTALVGERPGIAQQIDVMPTVLGYLHYDRPYVSFGVDLLSTPADSTFAVSYFNGIYQILMGDYFVQFDGAEVRAVYSIHDRLLRENLLGKVDVDGATRLLKAIIQQYMTRMNNDQLLIR